MLINPQSAIAQDEVREWNESQTERWGYLPNYAAAFASRPEVARAWAALSGAVGGGMDRRRFELATIAAARALRSTYCTAAHSKFLRDVCGDEPTMRAYAQDPDGGSLDPTDRAIVAFAGKVARNAADVSRADVDALHAVGLSDNDIADVVFAVALRAFFATALDGMGAAPDHQLAEAFEPGLVEQLTVGRPMGSAQP